VPLLIRLPIILARVAWWRSDPSSNFGKIASQLVKSVVEISHYTHPMKEDVKKKDLSPPLGETRVW
jgi:hypothetical protein